MRYGILLAAALTLAVAANGRAAPTAGPVSADDDNDIELPVEGAVTSNPDWVRLPTAEEVSRYYPPLARALGLSGSVAMICTVEVNGSVDHCGIRSESPAGVGFGQAAIRMTPAFQMKPQMVDGAPVGGAKVDIPFTFAMPHAARAPALPPDEVGPPPSARALDLARRLVADGGAQEEFDELKDSLVQTMQFAAAQSGVNRAEGSPAELIVQSWREAFDLGKPAMAERLAGIYARTFSEAELAQIVAFLGSPAGKAWTAHASALHQKISASIQADSPNISTDARRLACEKIKCLAADAPGEAAKPPP
jgi:TonB family protein